MKFIKQFKLFESVNEEEIHQICKKYKIENYTINLDGTVDVDGRVDLNNKQLSKLPLKFGKVTGSFNCSDNRLISLEGCPQSVSDNFLCSNNRLTSLKGCPQSVGGGFSCSLNNLTSLEGGPQSVGGVFYCNSNQLTSLEGCPQTVDDFYCSFNKLTSFEGAPSVVNGYFDCEYNQLTSFDGLSKTIGNVFFCKNNPVYNIWKLFEDKSLIEYFNEFDCIRGNELIIDRLNAFLEEIGKPNVESVEGYKNI